MFSCSSDPESDNENLVIDTSGTDSSQGSQVKCHEADTKNSIGKKGEPPRPDVDVNCNGELHLNGVDQNDAGDNMDDHDGISLTVTVEKDNEQICPLPNGKFHVARSNGVDTDDDTDEDDNMLHIDLSSKETEHASEQLSKPGQLSLSTTIDAIPSSTVVSSSEYDLAATDFRSHDDVATPGSLCDESPIVEDSEKDTSAECVDSQVRHAQETVTSGNVTSGNVISGNVTSGNVTSRNVTSGNVSGENECSPKLASSAAPTPTSTLDDFQPVIVSVRGNCDLDTEFSPETELVNAHGTSERSADEAHQTTAPSTPENISVTQSSSLSSLHHSTNNSVSNMQGTPQENVTEPASVPRCVSMYSDNFVSNSLAISQSSAPVLKLTSADASRFVQQTMQANSNTSNVNVVRSLPTSENSPMIKYRFVNGNGSPTLIIRPKNASSISSLILPKMAPVAARGHPRPTHKLRPRQRHPAPAGGLVQQLKVLNDAYYVDQAKIHSQSSAGPKTVTINASGQTVVTKTNNLLGKTMTYKSGCNSADKNNQVPVSTSTGQVKSSTKENSGLNSQEPESILDGSIKAILAKISAETVKYIGLTRQDLIKSNYLHDGVFPENVPRNPAKNYQCIICMEQFHLSSGLNYHNCRRIFRLVYECDKCHQTIIFSNKCTFWKHLITESPNGSIAGVFARFRREKSLLVLKPIGLNMPLNDDFALNKLLSLDQREKMCPGCEKNFMSPKLLTEHLHSRHQGLTSLHCNVCDKKFNSACSLKAHSKIHELNAGNVADFWCPECGEFLEDDHIIRGNKKTDEQIFLHLDKCFHFNKVHVVVCNNAKTLSDSNSSVCNAMFMEEFDLKSHLLKEHMSTLYKCHLCKHAFKDPPALFSHCKINHGRVANVIESLSKNVSIMVFCHICRTGCLSENSLAQHLCKHYKEMLKTSYVYKWKCFLCSKVFHSTSHLATHISLSHSHGPIRCKMCHSLFSGRQSLVSHVLSKTCSHRQPPRLDVCVDKPNPHSHCSLRELIGQIKLKFSTKVFSQQLYVERMQAITRNSESQRASNANSLLAKTLAKYPTLQNSTTTVPGTFPGRFISIQQSRPPVVPVSNPAAVRVGVSQDSSKNVTTSGPQVAIATSQTTAGSSIPVNIPLRVTSSLFGMNKSSNNINLNKRPRSVAVADSKPYQCHTCKIVIRGLDNLHKHNRHHGLIAEDLDMLNIRCVVCSQKHSFWSIESHVKTHQKQGIKICSRCQRRHFNSMREAIKCADTRCGYKTVEGEGFPFPENNDDPSTISVDIEGADSNTDVEEYAEDSSFESFSVSKDPTVVPCLLCGMTFSSKESHLEHVSRMHDGTRTVFYCLVCKKRGREKQFKKKQLAVRHMVAKHKTSDMDAIKKLIEEKEENVTSGLELAAPAPVDDATVSALVGKRLRTDQQGEFLCAKCGFSCNGSEEFSSHIATHNAQGEPQCPECGLCFTVATAMTRHLTAVHKIKAVDRYLKEKHLVESDDDDDGDGDEIRVQAVPVYHSSEEEVDVAAAEKPRPRKRKAAPVEFADPGECSVCYRVFDTEAELKSHMRIHGMAFIRSKRLRGDEVDQDGDNTEY